jgi:hypothetical protein
MPKRGESPKGGEVWVVAYRYQSMEMAGRDYAGASDIVFAEDIDAGALRARFQRPDANQ